MDRLQAVPHVGQGPADDDAHGVVEVAGAHGTVNLAPANLLFGLV